MYQPYTPYPSAASEPPPPVPQSVQRAVIAMYAGAAASVIGIAFSYLTLDSIRHQVLQRMHPAPDMTAQDFANLQHTISTAIGTVGLVVLVIGGLVDVGLWLWMAWKCKAGRSWARVVSTVFFGISTLGLLSAVANFTPAALWTLLNWLIGLAALILLWQRPSSDFFRATPRY